MRAVLAAAVVLAGLVHHAATRAAESSAADSLRIELAGTLRMPIDVVTDDGGRQPLSGLSGVTCLGGTRWAAALDHSDRIATFVIDVAADGTPLGVADIRLIRLAATHDYEDLAVQPPAAAAADRILLCEEDTPAIRIVALADGRGLGAIPLPDAFLARRPNRGPESLAVDPAGPWLWTALEEASAADGPPPTTTRGTVVRIARLALGQPGVAARQFAYEVDPPHAAVTIRDDAALSGVVALVALGGDRLLVLERSFVAGLPPFESRIYAVDASAAVDVAGVARSLADRPAATRLKKRLLWRGMLGANVEGLGIGPSVGDGRLLVAVADNGGTGAATLLATFRLTGKTSAVTSP